jgi:hypothetical protein
MIQAFQSLKNIRTTNEMVVINVKDRKISIPKLDLKVISEYGEPFKHNIQGNPLEESSILTES